MIAASLETKPIIIVLRFAPGRLIRCEAKRMKEGRRGAWSGIPPPASASDDAKERGPQPLRLWHKLDSRANPTGRLVITLVCGVGQFGASGRLQSTSPSPERGLDLARSRHRLPGKRTKR